MSRLTREPTIEEIESSVSILELIGRYTSLKRKGSYYLGLCPFHKDRSPSFSVKGNSWRCFACEISGYGVIDFLKKKEGVDFKTALDYLKKNYTPVQSTINRRVVANAPVESINIEFVDQKYTEQHLEYWKHLEMDEKWLVGKKVYAVSEWAMGYKNLKKIKKTKDEIVFAYYAEDIKKCKILRIGPEVSPGDKWRNSVPNNYLWYYTDYEGISPRKLGFTVKSVKDCLVLQKTGRCAIATNNESDKILLENNVERINKIFEKNIMCYGTDPDGKKKSIAITQATGWGWFNMENHLYDQFKIEDFADYLNNGFNYKQLERLLQNKKL